VRRGLGKRRVGLAAQAHEVAAVVGRALELAEPPPVARHGGAVPVRVVPVQRRLVAGARPVRVRETQPHLQRAGLQQRRLHPHGQRAARGVRHRLHGDRLPVDGEAAADRAGPQVERLRDAGEIARLQRLPVIDETDLP